MGPCDQRLWEICKVLSVSIDLVGHVRMLMLSQQCWIQEAQAITRQHLIASYTNIPTCSNLSAYIKFIMGISSDRIYLY